MESAQCIILSLLSLCAELLENVLLLEDYF